MDEKEWIEIEDLSGEKTKVEVITYLASEDDTRKYIVYTKNEIKDDVDYVIYVSKLFKDGDTYKLKEITDDTEWRYVQRLMKKIANAR